MLVSDAAVIAKVGLTGLAAGSHYWYRATGAAGDRSVGTFRTAAATGASTGLRFGVTGDWQAEMRRSSSIGNAPGGISTSS